MPGPPVSTILTSNDIGLGTNEMKVKGTFVLSENDKHMTSRYLFNSPEEEQAFIKSHPEYQRKPFLDLDDAGKPRDPDIPFQIKNQLKQDIGEKVHGSSPKKPVFKKSKPGKIGKPQ